MTVNIRKQKISICSILAFLCILVLFVDAAWSENVIITYNPRTGRVSLDNGKQKVDVGINKEIEKILSTAKQTTVGKNGVVTATVDGDSRIIRKIMSEHSSQNANINRNTLKVLKPSDHATVSNKIQELAGVVTGKEYKMIQVQINNNGKVKKSRLRIKNGRFKGNIELFQGKNIITLFLRAKSGTKTTRTVTVNYRP